MGKVRRSREEIRAHVLRRAGMPQTKIIKLAEKARLNVGLKRANLLKRAGRRAYTGASALAGSGMGTSAGIFAGLGTGLRSAGRQLESSARSEYVNERIARRLGNKIEAPRQRVLRRLKGARK